MASACFWKAWLPSIGHRLFHFKVINLIVRSFVFHCSSKGIIYKMRVGLLMYFEKIAMLNQKCWCSRHTQTLKKCLSLWVLQIIIKQAFWNISLKSIHFFKWIHILKKTISNEIFLNPNVEIITMINKKQENIQINEPVSLRFSNIYSIPFAKSRQTLAEQKI